MLASVLAGCAPARVAVPRPSADAVRAVQAEVTGADSPSLEAAEDARYCQLLSESLPSDGPEPVDAATCLALHGDAGLRPADVARLSPALLRELRAHAPAGDAADLDATAVLAEAMQAVVHRRIVDVGTRVVAAAGRSDLELIVGPEIGLNAFVPIEHDATAVYVGTELGLAAQSDDELACVLGHEVAHLTEGHVTAGAWANTGKAALAAIATTTAAAALGWVGGGAALAAAQVDAAGKLGRVTAFVLGDVPVRLGGWERDQEREADAVGLLWAVRAGYAPEACADFMVRMARLEQDGDDDAPSWWRVHPVAADRVVALRQLAAEARAGTLAMRR